MPLLNQWTHRELIVQYPESTNTSQSSGAQNKGPPCHPRNIWQCLETFWGALVGGMLKNILQCTRQAPTPKNDPALKVNSSEVEKTQL
jgi:hypothetical protein